MKNKLKNKVFLNNLRILKNDEQKSYEQNRKKKYFYIN